MNDPPSCSSDNTSSRLPEPTFRATHVHPGRITCQICFAGCEKKNLKRAKYERICDLDQFRQYAIRWQGVSHSFNRVYDLVDWSTPGDKFAHKSCKGQFLKELYLTSQKCLLMVPDDLAIETPVHDTSLHSEQASRRSSRKELGYKSSWQNEEKKRCIICNEDKWAKGRLIPVQTITLTYKAEKTLAEYANLHIKNNTAKYISGANRILLTLATKSLLAADVGYHKKLCYEPFRSPAWKRDRDDDKDRNSCNGEVLEEMYQLILVHIIKKHQVYTMAQLVSAFNQIRSEKGLQQIRTTDLKEKLQQRFGTQLNFYRPMRRSSRDSEYVFPEGMEFTAKCVESSVLGGGISKSVTLKNSARIIHSSILDTRERMPWPPTPQDILENEPVINTDLYNHMCWIINPSGRLDDSGRVCVSKTKMDKIHQICQDIQALLPNSQPSLDQALLSLTMHYKTGSSGVVDTLHSLGYGISYTETIFIEDKWAEWSESQHSTIPSNIVKGFPVTHVADNIDWKNKDISGMKETHNTNSILIQQKSLLASDTDSRTEQKAQVSVEPDYNFKRADHHSFVAVHDELPKYIPIKACPIPIDYQEVDNHKACDLSSLETLAWVKSRRKKDETQHQIVPALSAFRYLTTTDQPPGVNVGYLPAITAPPTDMCVILSIMNRTIECMVDLELDFIFLEADQAIYNKVLQVLFKFKQQGSTHFDKIIVRMGGFHIIMCLMKTIYRRFQGCGIVELLSEAGVGSEGTIKAGLNGANVKQGIRYYKLFFEALLRSKLDFIKSTCDTTQPVNSRRESPINQDKDKQTECQENIISEDIVNDNDQQNVEILVSSLRHEQTPEALSRVVSHPRLELLPQLPGDMASWMDSFIEMVDLLLNMIHFQRIGNWEGFLETVYQFLPWCFALNRQNYARNMSYYYVDMRDLMRRHPAAYQFLLDGGFTGSLSGDKHTKIPMDQIIEMTINRFSKDTGGLSGKTENVGACERWMRINHYLAALKQHLEQRTKTTTCKHVELGQRRMQKDEDDVERIVAGLLAWVPTLWSPNQPLINMATGIIAPNDLKQNVMTTKERGENARKDFFTRITKTIADETSNENQHPQLDPEESQNVAKSDSVKATLKYTDPIKKQPVLTFEKIVEHKKSVTIVEDEGQSFAAILADYDEKKLDLRYIMEWPITSKPWSICNEQGISRASSKSLFRNNLQILSPVPPTSTAPSEIECSIVDAMRVVRIIPINGLTPPTFKAWAERIWSYLKSLPGMTLHVVFDDYRSSEDHVYLSKGRQSKGRERRITDLSQQLPKLRDWNDFLTNDANKQQVTQLLADYFLSGDSHINKDVYVTKGNQCMYRSSDESSVVKGIPELVSFHREADPRLALHAVYASRCHPATCVVADDTDVYILLVFIANQCEGSLYFRQGTVNSKEGITYHNVKALAVHLGEKLCAHLPAFHVATGSDYTQPFYGRSKFQIFKKLQKNPDSMCLLTSLSSTDVNVDEVIDFVLHIVYNRPKSEKTPAESRYAMLFPVKGKSRRFTPLKRLPPDKGSLKCAIMRMNCVTFGMVNCLDQTLHSQLDPLCYGWKVENDMLQPIWYEGAALPDNEELSRGATCPVQSIDTVPEANPSDVLQLNVDDDNSESDEDILSSNDSSSDEDA